MIVERPSDHFARERVDDHGQINESVRQADVSDVGDPNLVEAAGNEPARQVGHDPEGMPVRRRRRDEWPSPQAQQVAGPHELQDPLGVDHEAIGPQPVGDPSVALVAVAQR